MTTDILLKLKNMAIDAECKLNEAREKHYEIDIAKFEDRLEVIEEIRMMIEDDITEPESVYGDFFERLGNGG
jgi:hypothetical protein